MAGCFHRLQVHPKESVFLPSGRVHGLGAGMVLFEIQQNSDTTYRVFDWNRTGLDGKPRELHISQGMASIDFTDFEPGLLKSPWTETDFGRKQNLVQDPLFHVTTLEIRANASAVLPCKQSLVVGTVSGNVLMCHEQDELALPPGQFGLAPSCIRNITLKAKTDAVCLISEPQ